MKIVSGKVVEGRIELPPGVFAEGEAVAVVGQEVEESFTLTREQEQELTEAIEAIARGEYIDGDEFVRQLKERHAG